MLSAADTDLLCRVGPGTPMGELFRQYWNPALLAEEVPESQEVVHPVKNVARGPSQVSPGPTGGSSTPPNILRSYRDKARRRGFPNHVTPSRPSIDHKPN